MAEVVTTQLLDPGLIDACGAQPGIACEWVWDATASETLAPLADWLIERPLKVLVILLGAVIVNRLVKRAIDRMVNRIVETRTIEESAAEVESSARLLTGLGRSRGHRSLRTHVHGRACRSARRRPLRGHRQWRHARAAWRRVARPRHPGCGEVHALRRYVQAIGCHGRRSGTALRAAVPRPAGVLQEAGRRPGSETRERPCRLVPERPQSDSNPHRVVTRSYRQSIHRSAHAESIHE